MNTRQPKTRSPTVAPVRALAVLQASRYCASGMYHASSKVGSVTKSIAPAGESHHNPCDNDRRCTVPTDISPLRPDIP